MVIGLVNRRPHGHYVLQLPLYCADWPGVPASSLRLRRTTDQM